MNITMLKPDEVLAIHRRVAVDFAAADDPIGDVGVREDGHLLESAVARQFVGFDGTLKYPSPFANAATLAFGLCCNHPFHNGNKRTALVAMLAHLDKNGYTLFGVRQREIYQMIKAVATHELGVRVDPRKKRKGVKYSRREADDEVEAIRSWLEARARRVESGERQITYRQLKQILKRFELHLDTPRNNKATVYRYRTRRRGVLRRKAQERQNIGSIPFPGEGKVVGMNAIKRIRYLCKLREVDGCDARSFYEGADVIESFINEYRGILTRLARQ